MNYPIVNREICGYCGACVSVCPNNAIELVDTYLRIDRSLCTRCLACVKVCPLGAIKPDTEYPASSIKHREYDVLVIGAGPAGSIAARTIAQQDLSVLLVEKRQEIGSPVRCAEGASRRALAELTEIDPRWIAAEISHSRIHSPGGTFVEVDPTAILVLERKIFDRDLAAQAARSGANVWVKSRAVDLIRENGSIAGAVIRRSDGDYEVRAKVVIAADGVESQVGRWAGIDTACKPDDVDTCAQYFMTGIDIDPTYFDIYVGHQTSPRGYAWIFPKGNNSANVGLGISGSIDDGTALDYLNRFVEKELPGGSILATVVGCVPVGGVLSETVRDGFMIIGDAAHQNDPVSGGGIINSMIAGQIAGEVASQGVKKGDVSRAVLAKYQKRWHRQVGWTFPCLWGLRKEILKFSDEVFNDIAATLSQKYPKKPGLMDMLRIALKNNPKLLLEFRHLISMGWGSIK